MPTLIQASNGLIIGDYYHTYTWINIASITASTVLVTLPLPGGVNTNIGRIVNGATTIFGSVDVLTGNMEYLDVYGETKIAICYEVLVCVDPFGRLIHF